MTEQELRLEALRLATHHSGHMGDAGPILAAAERFFRFLANLQDATPRERILEAMEEAGVR